MSKRSFILGGIAGFTLASLINRESTPREITPLTKYDITGDGVADYIVGAGEGISPRSLHVGYIDGKEVKISNPENSQVKYATTGDVRGIVQIGLPGIKEKSPNWFTSRVFMVSPTKEGKTLELSVSDGTLDGLFFEKAMDTTWSNPQYSK